jgi:hypothetical protein
MQWKWEEISSRSVEGLVQIDEAFSYSKQNPGHVFSPFVATEWSMDQLAPFCKLFPYIQKKTKATCS